MLRSGSRPKQGKSSFNGWPCTKSNPRIIWRPYDKTNLCPGFRIKLHQKDLNLALQGARELSLSLPGTALIQELFNVVKANYGDDLDHSALVMAVEKM